MVENSFIEFCEERLKVEVFDKVIEDIRFYFMPLNTDLYKEVQQCKTSEEMMEMAANYGLSFNRERMMDIDGLSQDFDLLWRRFNSKFKTTPVLRHQVGAHVCDISGLKQTLEDLIYMEKPEEPEETHLDGDNLPDGDVTLEQLEQDTQMHSHVA